MKQSIVEVIAYLLEMTALQQIDADSFTDQMVVGQRLEEAGFTKDIVTSTFDWLRELIEQQCWYADSFSIDMSVAKINAGRTLRIFDLEESVRIGLEVRDFILSLEFVGILDTRMREIVISQLMQLQQKSIELVDAKWVVLLVLMSKSNKNSQDMQNYLLTTMALEV